MFVNYSSVPPSDRHATARAFAPPRSAPSLARATGFGGRREFAYQTGCVRPEGSLKTIVIDEAAMVPQLEKASRPYEGGLFGISVLGYLIWAFTFRRDHCRDRATSQ